jgi:hypothetical protein
MFLPGSVLEQVQQWVIPQDWRVFQGNGKPFTASLLFGCFTLVFSTLAILCGIRLGSLTVFGLFNLVLSCAVAIQNAGFRHRSQVGSAGASIEDDLP